MLRVLRRSTGLRAAALAGFCVAPPAASQEDGGVGFDEAVVGFEPGELDLPAFEVDEGEPVALVADEVVYDEIAGTVTARGDVEVYYGPRTLRASEIVYDSRSGRIDAEGPLELRAEGGTTLYADAASLDPELRDGLVRGARAIIADGAAKLSAVEGRRVEGRYNTLAKAVYSPCEVCAAAPTPLWRIRARRIVHDEVERMIYYEGAVFDLFGTPIAYLPFFSHPDPTVKRKTGFLTPTLRNSSVYGYAAKVPYFFAIDASRDVTLTAFPTSNDGPIGEAEYRQRFDFGAIDLSGSLGLLRRDDEDEAQLRGHLFGYGAFSLARFGLGAETEAGFRIERVTDDAYLRRYDFTDRDRLHSEVFVERYAAEDFFSLAAVYFQSLRDDEPSEEVPQALPEFEFRRGFDDPFAGGVFGLTSSGLNLTREDGRELSRFTVGADWDRREVVGGVVFGAFADVRADFYEVRGFDDDPEETAEDGFFARLAPLAGVEARYPFIRLGARGSQVIEPIAQFVIAPDDPDRDEIPNEDSLIVEFDETNLFDANRFPGFDRFEAGTRLNAGMRYARLSEDGIGVDASFGRSFRFSGEDVFSEGSGLGDEQSDYVASWRVSFAPWLDVGHRLRIADDLGFNRNELVGRARYGRLALSGRYLFLEADATAGAEEDREEARLAGSFRLSRHWTLGAGARRNLELGEYVDARASLGFQNECAGVDLFVDRDFTSSDDAPADTSFGLQVRLFGVAGPENRRSRRCAPAGLAVN